jgi:hypothetical protein
MKRFLFFSALSITEKGAKKKLYKVSFSCLWRLKLIFFFMLLISFASFLGIFSDSFFRVVLWKLKSKHIFHLSSIRFYVKFSFIVWFQFNKLIFNSCSFLLKPTHKWWIKLVIKICVFQVKLINFGSRVQILSGFTPWHWC